MSWKYTCPKGHTYGSIQVKPTKDKPYYCDMCERHYAYMVDSTTGKRVDRSTK